jgi:hypothetical protein
MFPDEPGKVSSCALVLFSERKLLAGISCLVQDKKKIDADITIKILL